MALATLRALKEGKAGNARANGKKVFCRFVLAIMYGGNRWQEWGRNPVTKRMGRGFILLLINFSLFLRP
jgi:hypothetical protein